jgi:peroxiredoxin Q/BCP
MLKEGDIAPDFTTRDANGETIKLSDFHGQKVVIYFYPKDDTPGCTAQACSIRDAYADFTERGIKVLGISLDDETSHKAFAAKYDLPFTLLADTDRTVSEAYGTYGAQKFGEQTFMTNARKTFLVDEQGRIKKIFNEVNAAEHAAEVLAAF